jgi:hypothetical protein
MPFIGKQPEVGAYSKLDAITTSATATYNLTLGGGAYYPSSANHLLVSLNGVMQAPQDSFTVSGSTIVFASTLASTDSIDFIMALGDVLDIGTPSDGTVTSAKLDANLSATTLDVTNLTSKDDFIVNGTGSNAANSLTLLQGTNGYIKSNNNLYLGSQDTADNIVIQNGKVGINYGTPGHPLHLETAGGGNFVAKFVNTTDATPYNTWITDAPSGANGYPLLQVTNNAGNETYFRVDSGTRRSFFNGAATLNNSSVNMKSDIDKNCLGIHSLKSSNSNYYLVTFKTGSGTTEVGNIYSNGSNTTYATTSDYRLKENVEDLENASTRLNQLNPKRFNFINDESNTLVDGFLAHEVQSVVPEAVVGERDATKEEEYIVTEAIPEVRDEDGNVTEQAVPVVMGTRTVDSYQGIDQSKLVPILVASLQEALAEIETLKTRVQTLEDA